jgi:hypothetical protein
MYILAITKDNSLSIYLGNKASVAYSIGYYNT